MSALRKRKKADEVNGLTVLWPATRVLIGDGPVGDVCSACHKAFRAEKYSE
jgi:cytochrome c556